MRVPEHGGLPEAGEERTNTKNSFPRPLKEERHTAIMRLGNAIAKIISPPPAG